MGTVDGCFSQNVLHLHSTMGGRINASVMRMVSNDILCFLGRLLWNNRGHLFCNGNLNLFYAHFHSRRSPNLHSLRRFAIARRGIGAAVFRLCQLNQPFSFKKVVTPNFSSALHVAYGRLPGMESPARLQHIVHSLSIGCSKSFSYVRQSFPTEINGGEASVSTAISPVRVLTRVILSVS